MRVIVKFKDGTETVLPNVSSSRTVAGDTVLELIVGDNETIHYAPVSNLLWWVVA